ncbi:ATP-binding cassette domain-containing protein [Acetobacterium paludosum]|uniref:ATP-binding cassette domain-containing protein n=1 Tax=Acetobacterium paludosum TaxID=52693 RepID=A0A923HSL4_9FIRM|nr:ABC transporter ATP-binding protein [Acetobacterium paludosum]MBC3887027.1 ATP-binding cassette domain-containing protein [Acetobacterium paludosum]
MLKIDALGFGYRSNRKILDDIKFDVSNGECVAILGNNGAGKSTMLKCLNKIISPQIGTVVVNEVDILKLNRLEIAKNTAYVAQKSEGSRITVYDAILLGRKPYIKLAPKIEDYNIVDNIIERLNLENYSLRMIDELSGGELQKVMIARALAQEPKVLLLDEPTSCLDLKNQLEVLKLIQNVTKEKQIAVVIVIHDLNLALRYCDKFLFLKDNSVYCYGGVDIMTPENIGAVYQVPVTVEKYKNQRIVIPLT